MSIPKTIHYCWFGGGPKPAEIRRCMDTWSVLAYRGFRLIEWNEENADLERNEFVQRAYRQRKWAFVSDYIRLDALFRHGGIYLDTDVMVKASFEPLLSLPMFLGYIFDCSVGTAVIGAQAEHPIIGELRELYDLWSGDSPDYSEFQIEGKRWENLRNNNDLFTAYFVARYGARFSMNNTALNLGNVVVFPKEVFEVPSFRKHGSYSVHRCYGSWTRNVEAEHRGLRSLLKSRLSGSLLETIVIRTKAWAKRTQLPFYSYYKNQKREARMKVGQDRKTVCS